MMLSPGYTYDKAPDQEHFLGREKNATNCSAQILSAIVTKQAGRFNA